MKLTKKRVAGVCLTLALLGGTTMAAMADDVIKSQGKFIFNQGEAAFYASDLRYLNDKVNEQIEAVSQGKTSLAQTIAGKGVSVQGASSVPTFSELNTAIAGIGSGSTVGAGDVLSGKFFYNGSGYTEGQVQNWSGQVFQLVNDSVSVSNGKVTVKVPEII